MQKRQRKVLAGLIILTAAGIGVAVLAVVFSESLSTVSEDNGLPADTACGVVPQNGVPKSNEAESVQPTANIAVEPFPDKPVTDTPEQIDASQAQPGRAKVTIVLPPDPVLAWDLTKAEYERLVSDPSASPEEKLEAKSRLLLGFYRWPGRNAERLGGFSFDQTAYRELDGYERQPNPYGEITVLMHGTPPQVMLERRIVLNRGPSRIEFVVRVTGSREWAQRYFLAWIASPTRADPSLPQLGSEKGILVGDVCEGVVEDMEQARGRIKFVRHNVGISISLNHLRPDEEPYLINLVALAQKVDRKIQAQTHVAKTWDDLAAFCPVIEEFSFEAEQLPTADGEDRTRVSYAVQQSEDRKIVVHAQSETGGAGKSGIWIKNLNSPTVAGLSDGDGTYEDRPYRAWLVAYDDALLFSVAEASIMVRPPKDE